MKKNKTKRFENRSLEFFDVIQRFEQKTVSSHVVMAQGAIERLAEEGRPFWPDGQKQSAKWQVYCDTIRSIILNLSERRFVHKQELETALREFISEFEHSTHGLFKLLHGVPDEDGSIRQRIITLFEVVYRASTYAILAYWVDEKHEEKTTQMTLQISPNEPPRVTIGETVTHKSMSKPKNPKHRQGMQKLK
ncbi:MAG: hypothetical protein OXE76_06140 [Alphaproteobacteria bacterium]|nr:hypothetical protein [Alphaproteobacteria bacterium]